MLDPSWAPVGTKLEPTSLEFSASYAQVGPKSARSRTAKFRLRLGQLARLRHPASLTTILHKHCSSFIFFPFFCVPLCRCFSSNPCKFSKWLHEPAGFLSNSLEAVLVAKRLEYVSGHIRSFWFVLQQLIFLETKWPLEGVHRWIRYCAIARCFRKPHYTCSNNDGSDRRLSKPLITSNHQMGRAMSCRSLSFCRELRCQHAAKKL